ncbi:MAG: ISL3 family transposase [Deltaproteobacteria bacterium]|nr:ISL3 family transposase [Deltaproteobacteria bacterium]
MSGIKFNAFFEFCRVRVTHQFFDSRSQEVQVAVEPNKRYRPICHVCQRPAQGVHSYHQRMIRDMNVFEAKTWIRYSYRKVRCRKCGVVVEDLGLVDLHLRITRRLACYILELCRLLPIRDIARHLDLDWKTIKELHKEHLQEKYSVEDIGIPELLAVDEISLRKGHHDLTVILNWQTGRVLWVGEGRRYETLKAFFDTLNDEQRAAIKAIAMDMWDPYIKAVKECCPQAAIVFDQFHVVRAFGRVIDTVRNREYRNAVKEDKDVIKGSKYLLLKNRENLREKEKPQLKALLQMNQSLLTAYLLKDYLKKLWDYKYPRCAQHFLDTWCSMARESGIRSLMAFAKMLQRYAYGIISHCRFPLHTSRLEGVNNKIKVIKRRAYGFHDTEYFGLIIKNAFATCN